MAGTFQEELSYGEEVFLIVNIKHRNQWRFIIFIRHRYSVILIQGVFVEYLE
jgi:hypothetical protein